MADISIYILLSIIVVFVESCSLEVKSFELCVPSVPRAAVHTIMRIVRRFTVELVKLYKNNIVSKLKQIIVERLIIL